MSDSPTTPDPPGTRPARPAGSPEPGPVPDAAAPGPVPAAAEPGSLPAAAPGSGPDAAPGPVPDAAPAPRAGTATSSAPPHAPTPPGPPDATPPMSSDPDSFERLHPSVKWVWRLQALITIAVLGVLLLIPGIVLFFQDAAPPPVVTFAVLGAFAFLALLMIVWPSLSYRSWGHRLDERVFETRHGVIFRVRQLVPVNRVQHVDLRAGPLDRTFGLSSLVLFTAGTQAASVELPGLQPDVARRLRDHLIEVGGDDGV